MRLRPSGLKTLFFALARIGDPPATAFAASRRLFCCLAAPLSNARTCFNCAISRSIEARISATPIEPPLVRAGGSVAAKISYTVKGDRPPPPPYDKRNDSVAQWHYFSISIWEVTLVTDKPWKRDSRLRVTSEPIQKRASGTPVFVIQQFHLQPCAHCATHSFRSLQKASMRAFAVSQANIKRAAPPMKL